MFPQFVVDLVQATYAIPLFRASLRQSALLCLLAATAVAQNSSYRFDHWTTDNGLPQNTVNRVIQTRDGYLWLTTFDGLARFDGVRFTVFDKSNSRGINSNRFVDLYEAGDGTLLIGTEDAGLTVYRNGIFTTYTTADGLPSNQTYRIVPDLNDEPVITTPKGSVYLRGGKIVPAPPQYRSQERKLYLSPLRDGFAVARAVREQRLAIEVVFLTMHKDEVHFNEALNLGAKGYVIKDSAAADVVNCLKTVAAGQNYISPSLSTYLLNRSRRSTTLDERQQGLSELTPTERRVLALLADLKTSKQIASELGVSARTIDNHRANICAKLDLRGSHALVKFAVQHKSELS